MNKPSRAVRFATLGPIGYMIAPGTCATAATLPCAYLMATYLSDQFYMATVIIFIILSTFIINRALEFFKEDQDPSQIVLDEALGCLVTFYAVPMTPITIIIGFVLFRFFDITKWFGISKVERLIGALGIIADDLLAAILANVITRIIHYFMMGII